MIIYNDKGKKLLEIEVDDNSYRHRVIMGDYNLTLYYSLAEHVELPVGCYCDYQGERFTLERPEAFKMKHSRSFEYTVTMESSQAKAKIWKFRNPVDGRLKFSLTAKPHEHLQMFVDNMNRRDTGWAVGSCVSGDEVCISYSHAFCYEALEQMASTLNTEFEFNGKTVSLRKVEYNKNNPLPLSYGRGNGFKPNVGRSNYGETPPTEILYVQGGSDNIDPSKYGSSELLLPKSQSIGFDGVYFEDEEGFNADNARYYMTDDLGFSIRRKDKDLTSLAESSLDCSDIYPKRVGEISSVVCVDKDKNFYDIIDNSIPENLDYEKCLIDGETMTVIFQTGMLAGKEFEVKYYHKSILNPDGSLKKAARRFEITPQEIDGQTMPNETFCPRANEKYAVFKCMLPDAYICDNATKSGASWDMFRQAVKYLFDNEETKFTFTGDLDGIWAKKDWQNIGGRIKLGGYIKFSDERFQKDGVLVRITGIKDYINKPHSPSLELSNETKSASFSSKLKQLESEEVVIEDNHREAIQFTKRRFRDAKETMSMLEASLLENFTQSISPIAIQTMQMLVGDESLQFRFVSSKTNPTRVSHTIYYDQETKTLKAAAGIIQHLTLGVSSLSSSHKPEEYLYWNVEEFESARLEDGSKKYYMYAKVSKTSEKGTFKLSEEAIALEDVDGYYHLLVGVLNSEYNGERSFATLYGFTEILPGRITTDRVVSSDGNSYFDMMDNSLKLGDKLLYANGSLSISGSIDIGSFAADVTNWINGISQNADSALQQAIKAYGNANTAISEAKSAWDKALSASSDASTAISNAAKAKTDAATAITNAANAVKKAGSVEEAVNSLPAWSKEASIIKALESETIIVNGYIKTSYIDTASLNITNALSIGDFVWSDNVLRGSNSSAIQVCNGLGYIGQTISSFDGYKCYGYFSSLDVDALHCPLIYCKQINNHLKLHGNFYNDGGIYTIGYNWPFVWLGANESTGIGIVNKSNQHWFVRGSTSTNVACIDSNGNFVKGSDLRKKILLDTFTLTLDDISEIHLYKYRWRYSEEDISEPTVGVIAQYVGSNDKLKQFVKYNEEYDEYGVDYTGLALSVAVGGIKALNERVKALEAMLSNNG